MNTLLKEPESLSSHYWMLWVSPSKQQTLEIKALPACQRNKVLMLHPRDLGKLHNTLQTAISSSLYQSITINKAMLNPLQRQQLQAMAATYNTVLIWIDLKPSLNSASQLSLVY